MIPPLTKIKIILCVDKKLLCSISLSFLAAEKQPSLAVEPQEKNIYCVALEIFYLSFVIEVVKDFIRIGFNRSIATNVKCLIGVKIKSLKTYEKLILPLKINSQHKTSFL